MNQFIKNTFKTFSSNVIQLMAGIMTGFLVPRMLGVLGYANYKIYSLYLVYVALLSFGLGDGLLIKYSGIDKDDLDVQTFRYYTRNYYSQLFLLFGIGILTSIFFVPSDYKFVAFALCFTIFSSQTIGLHQNFSILTSRFGEYSKRIVIKSVCTVVLTASLFFVYLFSHKEVRYEWFIIGNLIIDYSLAFWYVYTYRSLNFGRLQRVESTDKYYKVLLLGIVLLFSNMSGTILLNLDRQFVSILFPKNVYAVYAFAYNMFALVTTITAAVSVVLFPTMKRIKDFSVKPYMEKYHSIFTVLVIFCLTVFFPLTIVIGWFLPNYVDSIEILRIILPGLVLSSCVNVIFFNFYKMENQILQYFVKTIVCIGLSAVLNLVAYLMTHDYLAISWASIASLFTWYLLIGEFFVRKHKVKIIKTVLYTVSAFVCFYLITGFIDSVWIGLIAYLLCAVSLTCSFFPQRVSDGCRLILAKRGRKQ